MTKVVPFSKFRIIFPIISVAIIAAGLIFTFATGGLNLGIDFRAGLNIRLQIAPVAARIAYTGDGTASVNIRNGELVTTMITADGTARNVFTLADYATVNALQTALSSVSGFSLEAIGDTVAPSAFLSFEREVEVGSIPKSVNRAPGEAELVDIADVRTTLAVIGNPQIQTIGAASANDFMIRIEEEEGATDFDNAITQRVQDLLGEEYGSGTVLIRQTDYVGARFSANLAQQTVYLSVLALLLILAYTWFRFRLAYAVSAITALLHDSLFIFAFIGATGLEFSTATIAAVLTIIGYSLNDTIVIFDRIRENAGILRNENFRDVVDTSITQSLSRTLMTSVTTLLAVLAIFIFGTGSIRDFALAMIVGVIVGTYSSIFIASPMLSGWVAARTKRRKAQDAERFGSRDHEDASVTPEGAGATTDGKTDQSATPPAVSGDGQDAKTIPQAERKLKGKRQKRK